MGRVESKTALITGAGRGIGRACAQLLAQEGACVYVTDQDLSPAREVAEEICRQGGQAFFGALDVRRPEAWQQMVAEIERTHGGLDVLVNNAGLYLIASIDQTSLDQLRELYETNVFGVWLGIKHVAPVMVANGRGSIINIASMDATEGAAGFSAYGSSKGAVDSMTRDAAMEFARRGVRVNSIHPGYIRTLMAAYGAEREGVTVNELGRGFPLGHIGEPIDVAWGVVYLASEESRWVTGVQLRIDGGATAGTATR